MFWDTRIRPEGRSDKPSGERAFFPHFLLAPSRHLKRRIASQNAVTYDFGTIADQ